MTATVITVCSILLLAYIFDITASKTKIPSVILLLILGYILKHITVFFGIMIPNLSLVLPALGTVGLILIVLEGSLELEINKSKLGVIIKSSLIAFLSIVVISYFLAYIFHYVYSVNIEVGLSNAIPFAIISSAIAIPSAKSLMDKNREFITYESSLSDIFGVIFFNNIMNSDDIMRTESLWKFSREMLFILLISIFTTIALTYFIKEIKHRIKFIPIILIVVLVYFICKSYDLPGLIFILLFGLFIGNINNFNSIKFLKIDYTNFTLEVHKFREITTEFAFLIRILFFLVFGFLIETSEIINMNTIFWAIGIVILIFSSRYLFLKIFKLPVNPLLFIAPRGLITILLFLYIPSQKIIDINNRSLITQVIILTSLVMIYGFMKDKKELKESVDQEDNLKEDNFNEEKSIEV